MKLEVFKDRDIVAMFLEAMVTKIWSGKNGMYLQGKAQAPKKGH